MESSERQIAMAAFGATLRRRRVAAGLTQEELAERADLSARGISDLERGVSRAPQPFTRERLAEALGLSGAERATFVAAARRARPPADAPDGAGPPGLPAPPTPLIGRERELAEAAALLRRGEARLLTIVGPPGVGKTRLGLAVAEAAAPSFADGVCVVLLAPVADPDLVPAAIARALGVRDGGDHPLPLALAAFLRHRQLLLLLDNCEHVAAATPLVGELLAAAPRLTVLATSRIPLQLRGEREYPAPLLALPPLGADLGAAALGHYAATALFVERARAARPDFAVGDDDAAAIVATCHVLDGLPLAIELAAARIRLLPPRELLARLRGDGGEVPADLRLLTGGARDLPARQRTLADTIAWSYDLLTPEERRLFRRLAIFVGGCTLAAAVATLAEAGGDVVDGLTSLLAQSLLYRADADAGEARVGMLATIRAYALERLADRQAGDGEADLLAARHAAHFLAFAEAAEAGLTGADQRAWLRRLDAEQGNLQATLRWALAHGDQETALRLGGALWRSWLMRGLVGEGRRWLERALAGADAVAPAVRAKALTGAGILAHYQGDLGRAAALCGEALPLARGLGARPAIVDALHGLALVARSSGNHRAATVMYAECLALLDGCDDPWRVAYTRAYSGLVLWMQGDDARAARRAGEEGMALFRRIGDRWGLARSLNYLGDLALDDDPAGARAMQTEALAIQREFGDRLGMARSLSSLGVIALEVGDYAAARRHNLDSLALLGDTGDRLYATLCLACLACLAAAEGQFRRAARLFGAADALLTAVGGTASVYRVLDVARGRSLTRAALDPATFAAATAEGQRLTADEAILADDRAPATTGAPSADQPPAAPRTATGAADGLTTRERDILPLVVQGLSDAAVAERLSISVRTVNKHVASILGKTGCPNRTALATWAAGHGLGR
jgi:predicted ATPase/DNA-binding CsgD family transcriptional regulator